MINIKKHKFVLPTVLILLFVFEYLVSQTLKSFGDEYISLASNYGFFTQLNFDAGFDNGGSYGVELTSGPISALGGVVGWILTKNLLIARFFNFLWVFLLQIVLIYIVKKYYEINLKNYLLLSSLLFVIIPWQFGTLYMLGEVPSTIIFFYSILLFPKNRNFSIILFSISIIYGKLILAIMFLVFYISYVLINQQFRNIHLDIFYFSIPLFLWLFFVFLFYEKGNIFEYVQNLFEFNVLNNRSVGIKDSPLSFIDYINSFRSSEVVNWNIADILRILISPLLFNVILLTSKNKVSNELSRLFIPVLFSTTVHYLWFWLMSPTKWIRYSQHFVMVGIMLILFLLSTEGIKLNEKINSFGIVIYLSLFLNSSLLIILTIFFALYYLYKNSNLSNDLIVNLITISFILNLINGIYETQNKTIYKFEFNYCEEQLDTKLCWEEYKNQ
tara:strand:+ start:537 stop:1865 length:1329 start_codon:yes stop_codon:yes gene_type:complete